jgi:hypothetical protein
VLFAISFSLLIYISDSISSFYFYSRSRQSGFGRLFLKITFGATKIRLNSPCLFFENIGYHSSAMLLEIDIKRRDKESAMTTPTQRWPQSRTLQVEYLTGAEEKLWEELNSAWRELRECRARNAALLAERGNLQQQVTQLQSERNRNNAALLTAGLTFDNKDIVHVWMIGMPAASQFTAFVNIVGGLVMTPIYLIAMLLLMVRGLVLLSVEAARSGAEWIAEEASYWWRYERPRPIKAIKNWWITSPRTLMVRVGITKIMIGLGYDRYDPVQKKMVRSTPWVSDDLHELFVALLATLMNLFMVLFVIGLILACVAPCILLGYAGTLALNELSNPRSPIYSQLRPTPEPAVPTMPAGQETDFPPVAEPTPTPATITQNDEPGGNPDNQWDEIRRYNLGDMAVSDLPWESGLDVSGRSKSITISGAPYAPTDTVVINFTSLRSVVVVSFDDNCEWASWRNLEEGETGLFALAAVRTDDNTESGNILGIYLTEIQPDSSVQCAPLKPLVYK